MEDIKTLRLREFFKVQTEQQEATIQNCREEWLLCEKLDKLYLDTVDALENIGESKTVHATLLIQEHYLFRVSFSLALATHLEEAAAINRKAIETAAYSYKMFNHPELQKIWMDASNRWNRFERQFKKYPNFPPEHKILSELRGAYKTINPYGVHANLSTLAGRLKFGDYRVDLMYFDTDRDTLRRTIFWYLRTYYRIIQVFEEIFSDRFRVHPAISEKIQKYGKEIQAYIRKNKSSLSPHQV
ncbi:hypothetical protein MYX84_12550 [Acidobacteria bacterium AH-259-O06]|nr:hypothetical protein [Acidobacteria bacterium AH-259-O06]